MKSIPSLLAVAITSTFIVAACSSSDGGGGGGVISVSEEQYAELYAKGVCGGFYKCDCPPSPVYDFADQAECEALFTTSVADSQDASRNEGLTFDAECAAKRVNSFAGNVCVDELWDYTHCGVCQIYHGDIPRGGSCTDNECDRGLECFDGVCLDPCDRIAEGDSCVDTVNKCEAGLFCEGGTSGYGTCVTGRGEGASCDDFTPCGADYGCQNGTCVKAALPGESCFDRPCATTQCVEGTCATTPLGNPNVCDLY
ncbi:MAG: hypothetical protein H6718_33145 [Polyangiaceae bacterium]|nr:hypothetical protein [Myxococcales bacterium]MCB9590304.1 hypothetical protein [Polyangiaceae bacterium]MCB9605041.1 hypothetical protein [Polyangiaceae bacterium]